MRGEVAELCKRYPGISNLSEGARRSAGTGRMHCPFCGHEETKVTDSRLAGEGTQIRRRRECLSCGERFTTFETRRAGHAAGGEIRPAPRTLR